MEYSLELMTGIILFVMGLSFLFRAKEWGSWFEDVRHDDKHRALPIGVFALFVSTFLVSFYQASSGVFVIVPIIGVLGIIESMLYLFFPGSLKQLLGAIAPVRTLMLRLWGGVFLFLAFLILSTLLRI